jgi:hypothetical protein
MILATARQADAHTEGLDLLAHLAAAVLNEHVNADGHCATCREAPFPCDSAVLAEHNIALLP